MLTFVIDKNQVCFLVKSINRKWCTVHTLCCTTFSISFPKNLVDTLVVNTRNNQITPFLSNFEGMNFPCYVVTESWKDSDGKSVSAHHEQNKKG